MSNSEASKVYELIVSSVINEVREDFENAGIDEQTLQDLKRVWQSKLTETKVTNFTWDEEVFPHVAATEGQQLPGAPQLIDSNLDANGNPVTIVKEEEGQNLVLPGLIYDSNSTNGVKTENEKMNIPEPLMKKEESHSINQVINNASSANDTQDTEREQTDDVPESTSPQQIELTIENANDKTIDQLRLQEKKAKRSALLDNDEVGSELDDSDDDYLISEGEDDGPDENLMLCLYDKVTRTKARWKCSLKDGIVTIAHKDYSFQKAQVEAEWV
ncbi:transcription initiation factor IIA large subunit NDAI_0E02500 [Naumovozyma dairenensis CBS 421]|uniref:Transcription initiation factor IIA large subunit n=1 Tax=Naumovozyma dairenensis (strain ATCC 10597 / BCRC 20456 / CBS 421 / NBRC 0211 / NRRL Y-12639) TaxID=1071378 RepID=G0WBE7_NAUDC|nr:hypothetical protein NDAI_0E02500 [Naumovozyma dairenensis CBS 421]CCD25067.1 hypothetical protein NDAI_0E02500 [Naumovozyma dairenensis CBS 421]